MGAQPESSSEPVPTSDKQIMNFTSVSFPPISQNQTTDFPFAAIVQMFPPGLSVILPYNRFLLYQLEMLLYLIVINAEHI